MRCKTVTEMKIKSRLKICEKRAQKTHVNKPHVHSFVQLLCHCLMLSMMRTLHVCKLTSNLAKSVLKRLNYIKVFSACMMHPARRRACK